MSQRYVQLKWSGSQAPQLPPCGPLSHRASLMVGLLLQDGAWCRRNPSDSNGSQSWSQRYNLRFAVAGSKLCPIALHHIQFASRSRLEPADLLCRSAGPKPNLPWETAGNPLASRRHTGLPSCLVCSAAFRARSPASDDLYILCNLDELLNNHPGPIATWYRTVVNATNPTLILPSILLRSTVLHSKRIYLAILRFRV